MSTSDGEYIILSRSEKKMKDNQIFFSAQELETLIECKDTIIKFLKKSIHKIQADLWNFNYVGKEWEAYAQAAWLKLMIDWLDNTLNMYKQFIKEEAEEKERKEKQK